MLFGNDFMRDRKDEDSLENTFSCVPKVQGVMPNLSGERTEMLDSVLLCTLEQSS